jgi:CheY-like chemotaxis protein
MSSRLAEQFILVVEDEPIIALDIADALECLGAKPVVSHSLKEALDRVEDHRLSAAVVDHRLRDGDSSRLCERLSALHVPFVLYTGSVEVSDACRAGVLVRKPAQTDTLVLTVERLIRQSAA